MTTLPFFCHPDFNATSIEFDTVRKAALAVESLLLRPIPGVELRDSNPVRLAELELVHDPAYVAAVRDGEPSHLAESNGIGWDEGLFAAVCASTGGARDAALWAWRNRRHAGAGSSGLHHARYERGSGFCTFNGLVVAARAALADGAKRVLIVDLDAHCGGGTASLIEHVDGIEQIDVSVDRFDHYRSRPDARLWMAEASDYLDMVREALASVTSPETVDVVLYNAGMDPHEFAGGARGVSTSMLAERDRLMFQWANEHGLPVAFVFAGGYEGYGLTLDQVVDLHRLTIEAARDAQSN
jgi:acetoin utilization deacetylase AcuC-like enzyme